MFKLLEFNDRICENSFKKVDIWTNSAVSTQKLQHHLPVMPQILPSVFCPVIMSDSSQDWRAWTLAPGPQQAAIVLALHGAVSRIHGVLKSERGFSPVLIKACNMRECGGLLFQPRRELTREACCRWKLRCGGGWGARAGLRHRRSTMALSERPERLTSVSCRTGDSHQAHQEESSCS